MQNILLGQDRENGKSVYMPVKALKTHLHLIGGTGKGKPRPCIRSFSRSCWIASTRGASSFSIG